MLFSDAVSMLCFECVLMCGLCFNSHAVILVCASSSAAVYCCFVLFFGHIQFCDREMSAVFWFYFSAVGFYCSSEESAVLCCFCYPGISAVFCFCCEFFCND